MQGACESLALKDVRAFVKGELEGVTAVAGDNTADKDGFATVAGGADGRARLRWTF